MINPIYSAWSSFLEDIGVSPPNVQSPIAVRQVWCPDGTKDHLRLTQKRPLLRKLLFDAIEGRIDESEYPNEWRMRKSFKKLFQLNHKEANPVYDFELWVESNIDEKALSLVKSEHKELLQERFNQLVEHLNQIRNRAAALESRYQERKKEVEDRLRIFIKMKSGPGHTNRMKNIRIYKTEIVDSLGDALVVLKSIERALIEDMQEMVLDAMNSGLSNVDAKFSLPSLDSLLSTLEMMPDFSSDVGIDNFENNNYASAIESMLDDYKEQISEITYNKIGIEKHLQDIKISLNQGGGINFMQNIVTGDGNKFAQANQTTNISSTKPE